MSKYVVMKLYSNFLNEYAQEGRDNSSPVTWSELSELRNHMDELWKKFGVDITFTNHFFDRVNDPRNRKQITIGELSKLFSETYTKHGHNISMKVKPGSDNEFEAVITDLSTKVNLPFVLEWDRKSRQLRLVAKTVMRKNDFKTPDQRFVVQQFDPTEKKMKTYRDITEWVGWNTPEVAPIATPQAVDDVDSAAFSVEKPEILEKLNAYCHDIANHQYINPYYPLNALWKKLMVVGINFDLKALLMTGVQGRVEVPLNMYGGRFGALGGPSFVSADDGITNRVPGGLNLVVTYQKTGGVYTLDATIEHGVKAIGFGEEVVSEAAEEPIHKQYKYQGKTKNGTLVFKHPEGHQFHVQDMPAMAGRKADIQWGHRGADSEATTQGFGYPGLHKHLKTFHGDKKVTEAEDYNQHSDCGNCAFGKSAVKEAKEFHSGVTPKKHPFHSVATQHGFEHEVSHEDGHGGYFHTYFHPEGGPALALGTHLGKPAWMHNKESGTTEHGLRTSLKKK